MPLSDKQILQERDAGNIVIEPFDRRNLGSDTYDVRLGEFFYREQDTPKTKISIGYGDQSRFFNIFDPDSVQRTWGKQLRAMTLDSKTPGWNSDDRVFLLHPGETILAHTIEFIGARRNYTTRMHARSSAGRSMLGVCKCAGRGDVGFFNRWTMEITSFSRYHVIPLKVGMRIAQIEFMPVGDTERVYGETHGKYQDGSDMKDIMANWKPEMMLPRFHLDWELQK